MDTLYEHKYPPVIVDNKTVDTWDDWLQQTEIQLQKLGYRKYYQKLKQEDFAYWKIFYNGSEKIYQIGLYFYDFRKYA